MTQELWDLGSLTLAHDRVHRGRHRQSALHAAAVVPFVVAGFAVAAIAGVGGWRWPHTLLVAALAALAVLIWLAEQAGTTISVAARQLTAYHNLILNCYDHNGGAVLRGRHRPRTGASGRRHTAPLA